MATYSQFMDYTNIHDKLILKFISQPFDNCDRELIYWLFSDVFEERSKLLLDQQMYYFGNVLSDRNTLSGSGGTQKYPLPQNE